METAQSWKMTFSLLKYSTGVSVIAFLVTSLMMEQIHTLVGVALFTLITLLLHFVLFRSVAHQLTQITIALNYLHQNTPVTEIGVRRSDPLKPLIDSVNALIRERTDLKTMRGQLVEQITATAAQEERNRLARDLHDSIKQQVFSMSISAAAAYAHLDRDPVAARAALLDVKQSAQEAMIEMRALLQQLSPAPLEKSGLIQALRDQTEALAYRTGAKVETRFGDLPSDQQLPPGTQETLFRIAQEALSNIARHARAQHVSLTLETDDQQGLVLCIKDDGQGFTPEQPGTGMGLSNIRSRAGGIGAGVEIMSQVGVGTELRVTVPLIEEVNEESLMQSQYDTQLKPVLAHSYRFAGAAALFIVAVSMLVWRLLDRPEGITEDTLLLVLMGVFALTAVISLPFALWSMVKARSQASTLMLSAGHNSRVDYKLRRNMRLVYIIIGIACGWFLPILAIGLPVPAWVRLAIGVVSLVSVFWNYKRMSDLYQQELALMNRDERVKELDTRLKEVQSGWVTVLMLFTVIMLTTLSNLNIQLPPQEPDHWMNVSFLTISLLLLFNQIIGTITYHRWRKEAA